MEEMDNIESRKESFRVIFHPDDLLNFSFLSDIQVESSFEGRTMAAIIAHITRSNRERLEKKKYEIIISKCMYEIRPFERCFDAKVSFNYYI